MPAPPQAQQRQTPARAWAMLALVLAALALLIAADLYRSHQRVGDHERDQLLRRAAVVDVNLGRNLRATHDALGTVIEEVKALQAQQASPETINRRLEVMSRSIAGVRGLLVVNADGIAIASNLRPLVGRSYRETDHYQASQGGTDPDKLYVSRPFTNPLGDHSLALSRVLRDQNGRYAGFVGAGLDSRYFRVLLDSLLYAPDMQSVLLHGSGEVILRLPDTDPVAPVPVPLSAARLADVREYLAGTDTTRFRQRYVDDLGRDRMGVLHTLRPDAVVVDFPLLVAFTREQDSVYAQWTREAWFRAALFAVIALVAALGLWRFQSRQRAYLLLQREREADQALAAAQLQDSEERFRRLFEDMRQPVLLLQNGLCVAANRAAAALFRVDSPDELLGPLEGFHSPLQQPDGQPSAEKAQRMLALAGETGSHAFEWQVLRRDGSSVTTQALLTVIRQGGSDLLHLALNDVTAQKQAQEQVEFLAFHDPASGLPNRVAAMKRLESELARARERRSGVAVLCVEVKGPDLKRDRYGHMLEEPLFLSVATRVADGLGIGGQVYRWDHEHLLAVIPGGLGYDPMSRLVDEILERCSGPYGVEGLQLRVAISVGVAFFPQDGADADTLVRHTELALHEARAAGPGQMRFFARQMAEAHEDFLETRDALRAALERQEFELHYQPQVTLEGGGLCGVEALLRWRRPGRGLLAPEAFMPVALASGLIVPIGLWVLRQACHQGAAWRASGWKGLVVSVNLSVVELCSQRIEAELLATLSGSGLEPSGLELEFTEAALDIEEGSVERVLCTWRQHGIGLAVDRYGSGRSRLAQLQRLGVGRLKVRLDDHAGQPQAGTSGPDAPLWLATAQTARLLGMRSTVVGVEDGATAHALQSQGFTEGQGGFFSLPVPAQELQQRVIAVDAAVHGG